jgi:excisionase family DNA binding protein
MTPQTLARDWLTAKQAADYLAVDVQYVQKLFREGKLTGWKGQGQNGKIHISAVSIEKFTEKQEAQL